MILATGFGLWFLFVVPALIYLGAHLHARQKRLRELQAEIIRSVVVPSRDAHLAEKPFGE